MGEARGLELPVVGDSWLPLPALQARMVLHIELADIAAGMRLCAEEDQSDLTAGEAAWASVERVWEPSAPETAFFSLSVRTTLMLLFAELRLPRGSEVLVTALTIMDVLHVIRHFGLVPVPIDVELETLAPRADLLAEAVTGPAARVLVLTYVFGSRYDPTPYAALARARGLLVIEDCAQAFVALDEFRGSACADVSLFSFGTIKRATALGGSLATVRGRPELVAALRARRAALPARHKSVLWGKLAKGFALRYVMAQPAVFAAVRGLVVTGGGELDALVSALVRGFPGDKLIEQLSHRPEPAMARLLERRLVATLSPHAQAALRKHKAICEWVRASMPATVFVPGAAASVHSYWLFPVVPVHARALIAALADAGVDATQGTSQMKSVPVPHEWLAAGDERALRFRPRAAEYLLGALVYLPVSGHLPSVVVRRMARVVRSACARELPHGLASKL